MKNQKTWVEIDQGKILYNYDQFRRRVGEKVKVAAVVKANAYGHGLTEIVSILKNKAECFCVDSFPEAKQVRLITKKPILILGNVPRGDYGEAIKTGFELTVFDLSNLGELDRLARKMNRFAHIHLEIETGTARNGILLDELEGCLKVLKKCSRVKLAGVFTHFANIEDTTNHPYAKKQIGLYKKALSIITDAGFSEYKKHCACSAAAILFKETHFDFIRLGISLYGMWSSKETKLSAQNKKIAINLKPALTWKTRVAHLKTLPAGSYVGYGCSEKLMWESKLAVIPVGYYEGFDRGLSSVGEVLIRGVRCRVLGRVCMNMSIIDVSHVKKVSVDDEVVIIGKQGKETLTAEAMAAKQQTINYEVTTRINPLIHRKIS